MNGWACFIMRPASPCCGEKCEGARRGRGLLLLAAGVGADAILLVAPILSVALVNRRDGDRASAKATTRKTR
eukprot:scaffold121895_cov36-Tisochrysis_lutea.AAC.1